MSYIKWFEKHAQKHKKIVDKLRNKNLTPKEIVEYFRWENMVENEVDFCPLYLQNKKCHDMDELNCYLCACPNFRFDDNGLATYNGMSIKSKCAINNGTKLQSRGVIHQDCSSCKVPHYESYILKNFSYDWAGIMSRCKPI